MSDLAIRTEDLSKMYRIGAIQSRYQTMRDTLMSKAKAPFRRVRRLLRRADASGCDADIVWALKHVSIEIRRGEVVGIVGRNGAGKSTLLKVLSRITEPTEGFAEIRGRVGSLLEVGTGFHPELTGRENIFLNGAVLGMRRTEITRKFDQIVAFAEVERFLDTPVKFYSSGMYMRLAFAVAAHLEPDILLVDEVLAVGDLAFQKKCMTRMRAVAREGKTVLLVSHNMAAIQSLANSAILLAGGQAVARGTVGEVIAAYTRAMAEQGEDGSTTPGLFNLRQPRDRVWNSSLPFEMELDIGLPARAQTAQLWCLIRDTEGTLIVQTGTDHTSNTNGDANQSWSISLRFPPLNLRPGLYQLQFRVFLHGLGVKNHFYSDPIALEVSGDKDGTLSNALLAPPVPWDITSRPASPQASMLVHQVNHA